MGKPLPLRVRVFITTAISSLIPLLLAVSILHFSFIDSFEEQIANQAMDIATLAAQRQDGCLKLPFGVTWNTYWKQGWCKSNWNMERLDVRLNFTA